MSIHSIVSSTETKTYWAGNLLSPKVAYYAGYGAAFCSVTAVNPKDSSYIICGSTGYEVNVASFIGKTDAIRKLSWTKNLQPTALIGGDTTPWKLSVNWVDSGVKVSKTTGNVYVLGGWAYDNVNAPAGTALCKYSSDGTLLWVKNFTGNNTSNSYDPGSTIIGPQQLHLDSSENVYVMINMGGLEGNLLKFDSSGTIVAQRTIVNTTTSGAVKAIANPAGFIVDKNDNIYMSAGSKYNFAAAFGTYNEYSYDFIKLDTSLNVVWKKTLYGQMAGRTVLYQGYKYSYPKTMGVDSQGNVYTICPVAGFDANFITTAIIKYAADGTLVWQKRIQYSDPSELQLTPRGLICDKFDRIHVFTTVETVTNLESSYSVTGLILTLDTNGTIKYDKKMDMTPVTNTYNRCWDIKSIVGPDDKSFILNISYNYKISVYDGTLHSTVGVVTIPIDKAPTSNTLMNYANSGANSVYFVVSSGTGSKYTITNTTYSQATSDISVVNRTSYGHLNEATFAETNFATEFNDTTRHSNTKTRIV